MMPSTFSCSPSLAHQSKIAFTLEKLFRRHRCVDSSGRRRLRAGASDHEEAVESSTPAGGGAPEAPVAVKVEEIDFETSTFEYVEEYGQAASQHQASNLVSAVPPPFHDPAPFSSHSRGPLSPASPEAGWIWALAVLAAVRLGRASAEAARLDPRKLQLDREGRRALSRELRMKREVWRLEQAERSAAEDALRVEEAGARAREEARRRIEEQRKYQEEAAREAERIKAERDSKRQQYEAEQAKLEYELQTRAEQEARVIEEQRARARAEEDARRREAQERRQQQEKEALRREEEARLAREEAIRQKLEERRLLEGQKKRFALRVEGKVGVAKPPKGTLAPGPLGREATIRLAASAGTLLGGQTAPVEADYSSSADAAIGAVELAGRAARAACDAAGSSFRLQAVTDEGPLAWMDEAECRGWMAMTTARATVAGVSAAQRALGRSAKGGVVEETFQARTEHGVLPEGHSQQEPAVLRRIIAAIEAEEADAGPAAEALSDSMEEADEAFYKDLDPLPEGMQQAPRFLGSALALAALLDRMLEERPAKISDAPAWFERAAALVRRRLAERTAGAHPDSLRLPAAVLAAVLGAQHPVAAEAGKLAEANTSAATRRLAKERQAREETELAQRLLEEEWPNEAELKAARAADREAKTPVPERVWALRNVAATLAMGGPGERGRARQLLERAVLLKKEFAGAADHPAVLPELLALGDVLSSSPEWAADARGVAALALRALTSVAAAYQAAGDSVSAAIVLEDGLRVTEEALGSRHSAATAAVRRAESLVEGMAAEEREAVGRARRSTPGSFVSRVASGLTEELGAYRQGGGRSRVQEWGERGVGMIGPLRGEE